MEITDFHAKLFAHELTKRSSSDSVEKLAHVLADAQVDLNPHQVEAALFAFRNPFSKGAILADEVGLGKTIEAGLLLAQKWAERKRRLLVLVPANLRKQWAQELADKFYLPSVILEAKSFRESINSGNLNPFEQEGIILCSYQFAKSQEPYVRQTKWDLVVIDEAHRLRNVYRGTSKIATSIKNSVAPFPKVLLTATPLQNSLMELYGLVSIIDDFAFGDPKSYKSRFSRPGDGDEFVELKERLAPLCKRTLRRQVVEYVSYTNRHALVQEFVPSADEQRLYDLVSEYLQQEKLYALPNSQRALVTLVLRKLLASSTYAITGTLESLASKLSEQERVNDPLVQAEVQESLQSDWEQFEELADEWEEDDDCGVPKANEPLSPTQLDELRSERDTLHEFIRLAKSITKNSKGETLLSALRKGFAASEKAQLEKGAATLQQKAVIFTESRRTQEYLYQILENTEFKGKVMMFNGTNASQQTKEIYERWLAKHLGTDKVSGSKTADTRQALVEHFRDHASILIATEAAAEGINLQFCNLVVNYDLPWNPQRIEQRIGRCHRYGQKFDVVVVNFLNKSNAADQRVYELLAEKFKLFDGVFGASDDVLGAVESGVDFEKRIATIYQTCRTPQQIAFDFDQLQKDLEGDIAETRRDAREKLLDNFDQEVVEKVKLESKSVLDRFQHQLWLLTRHVLREHAQFHDKSYSFELMGNPFPGHSIHSGPYRMAKDVSDGNTYRIGHPLAQKVIETASGVSLPPLEVVFNYSEARKNIAVVADLVGKSGYLLCSKLTMTALETEDRLVMVGVCDDGEPIDAVQCRRLFDLPAQVARPIEVPSTTGELLVAALRTQKQLIVDAASDRNGEWFDTEMEKLDHWAEDRRASLKSELAQLDLNLKEAKKAARLAGSLPEKLEKQRLARGLESKREEAWRTYDQASREVDRQKDAVLDEISQRLEQKITETQMFQIRWSVR